jgi:hypothetical protein
MKFWLYLSAGLALFIAVSWLLAVAAGLLQYLIGALMLGALVFGIARLLRSRALPQHLDKNTGFRDERKAERELRRMEKQQARRRAR